MAVNCLNSIPKEKQDKLLLDKMYAERDGIFYKAVLALQKKFGKNAVLKGMNLQEGATAMERNRQIGGHKA